MLDEWNYVCNYGSSRQGLGYLTPMEFLNSWMEDSKNGDRVSTM